ncbi:hypothetical protein J2D73_04860 [Acetobacter sacchari]|uniref:Uncharacterized protein n=1 Tax=Acetobacter sacchari TaxID=2661687 RepID=A0ABS3LT97_9PROT|nr:hypothetical protein [Acetobacter sacchari]MBO1359127.1 hypothetical protein [Acetobacter sacchari]
MSRHSKIAAVAALCGFALASGEAAAASVDTATQPGTDSDRLVFQVHSANLGPGYAWGQGILHYKGADYRISVSGGGAPALGYSKSCAEGSVANLGSVNDFDSTFWAVDAEATAGGGSGAMALENAKGVELRLTTHTHGVRLSAEASRLRFRVLGKSTEGVSSVGCS